MTLRDEIFDTITKPTMSYRERVLALAKTAENQLDEIDYSSKARELMNSGVIFDMYEGKAPFRPRYCVPDYPRFMRQGSKFIGLVPPTDIWSAVGNLMCFYHNMTSSGGLPVYAGCLDELLEPFVTDRETAKKAIEMLLLHLDGAIGDSFCQIDLSGRDTVAGRIILELSAQMKRPCPNMSMLYRSDTPDDFALAAIRAGLECSKPSFANDALYRADCGDYAVVSCYNTLPIGGSGMTLVRLNINRLACLAHGEQDLIDRVIPEAVDKMCEVIDKRIQYIVDTCSYYENTYLFEEGLIKKDRDHMIGMFGYAGLAECVNAILGAKDISERFGHCERADALGERIMDTIKARMDTYTMKYGKLQLHAQVGVSDDVGITPGGRIPIGDEPELLTHIRNFARVHRHCAAGCGEIFPFDETAKRNPLAILDIIKGAFSIGARYISFYSSDADVVRITGYLVKRSDIEKLAAGKNSSHGSTVLGKEADETHHLLDRKVRSL